MIRWIKKLIADRKYKKSVKNYELSLEGIFKLNNLQGRNELLKEKWDKYVREKNSADMRKLIVLYENQCEQKNSNCMKETFCPECPFGLLNVRSYRSGW